MYVRCRLDRSRNRIESRYPHVVAKAVAQPTREPILKKNRETCRNVRNVENTHKYFTITFEELKEENTIMTINEFKQYEQIRPKMRTKAKPGKGWKGITSEKRTGIS